MTLATASVNAGGFRDDKLRALDRVVEKAIQAKLLPGAVLWIEAEGNVYQKAYGHRALKPRLEIMTLDTIFDLASLTKVLGTTPSLMKLVERGSLRLDQSVVSILPEFKGNGKESITVRQLMTHTSGLAPGIPKDQAPGNYAEGMSWIYHCQLQAVPDTVIIYSDLNYHLLGEILQRLSGERIDVFARREIWLPLGMETRYAPPESLKRRIAPTEKDAELGYLRGIVHDPTSRRMGCITGHAGAFGTAADVARYARMMLEHGKLEGVRVLEEDSVLAMTHVQTSSHIVGSRGLGWDIDSTLAAMPRGKRFTVGESYGHTGWTGTSVWIDPARKMFVVLMSNRNHPSGGEVRILRHEVATLAAEAAEGITPKKAAPQPVLNGIDVLAANGFRELQGKNVGLITNHTGQSRDGKSTIDLLHQAKGVTLKAIFSPEHGIRGKLDQAVIDDETDTKTGLPVYSLYKSEDRQPTAAQLKGIDTLVFDVQDIGCRYFTYISTMGHCMEAAGKHGLAFFVLDRVNPIGGTIVDGPVAISRESFTSYHPIAIQHGMTVGELAEMFRVEKKWKVDLNVIPVANWSRGQRQDDAGLTWVNPSPNMRSLTEAILYPGIAMLEFTKISVGRGTDTPFEHVGAPGIDAEKLAAELRGLKLPGLEIQPTSFTPAASVFANQLCHGVRFKVTDRETARPIDLGLAIARYMVREHADYDKANLEKLLVHPGTLAAIRAGKSNAEIRALWANELTEFKKRRKRFLRYE